MYTLINITSNGEVFKETFDKPLRLENQIQFNLQHKIERAMVVNDIVIYQGIVPKATIYRAIGRKQREVKQYKEEFTLDADF